MLCNVSYDELNEEGYLCTTAFDGNAVLTKLAIQDFDIALLDIMLPGISGVEILRNIRLNHNNISVIMITAVNDIGTAVEAMKLGAQYGIQTLDQALLALCRNGIISREQALAQSVDAEELKGMIDGPH